MKPDLQSSLPQKIPLFKSGSKSEFLANVASIFNTPTIVFDEKLQPRFIPTAGKMPSDGEKDVVFMHTGELYKQSILAGLFSVMLTFENRKLEELLTNNGEALMLIPDLNCAKYDTISEKNGVLNGVRFSTSHILQQPVWDKMGELLTKHNDVIEKHTNKFIPQRFDLDVNMDFDGFAMSIIIDIEALSITHKDIYISKIGEIWINNRETKIGCLKRVKNSFCLYNLYLGNKEPTPVFMVARNMKEMFKRIKNYIKIDFQAEKSETKENTSKVETFTTCIDVDGLKNTFNHIAKSTDNLDFPVTVVVNEMLNNIDKVKIPEYYMKGFCLEINKISKKIEDSIHIENLKALLAVNCTAKTPKEVKYVGNVQKFLTEYCVYVKREQDHFNGMNKRARTE